MCKPIEVTSLRDVQMELLSAISALNMHPEALPPSEIQGKYLSDVDRWAKHSKEHIYNAYDSLAKLMMG